MFVATVPESLVINGPVPVAPFATISFVFHVVAFPAAPVFDPLVPAVPTA